MKKIKFLSLVIAVIIIISSFFTLTTSAATSVLSFSANTVNVGDKVTVTVSVKGSDISGVDLSVSYNSDILRYDSGATSGGAGSLKIVELILPTVNSKSYSLSFTALKAGSSQISFNGTVAEGDNAADVSVGASATLSVINKVLSDNANLKSLRLGVGTLSPAFSPDITTYDVLIPNSATKCLVYATTADPDATLDVEGSSTMEVGANKRVVVVTAPNGTQKSYTINITRSDLPDGETPPTESDVTSDTLSTTLESANYVVATDISSIQMFKGFTATTALYNGVDVPVAIDNDGNFKIYYLKSADSEALIPCTLDNETNTFKKLKYITQGEYTYIVTEFPKGKEIDDKYYRITAKISDFDIECYANQSSELNDFYYIYCFANDRYGVYRYDSRENTIHRYPEFKLTDATTDTNVKDLNFLDKFASLPTNSKLMVACLFVAIVVAITLIILIIIKLIHNRNDNLIFEDEDDDLDFENVSFDNDFLISSNDNSFDKDEDE